MPPFTITGVPKSDSSGPNPPPRLEINDFVKHEKFFSLYIQALQKLYERSQTDKGYLSYFQIAGIHGNPKKIDWNETKKNGWFCKHGTDLFPTWHRPYVALFEQAIHEIVVDIAKTYTVDTAAWQQAADDLRQPFWDWSKNIIPPKEVIELEEVVITTPTGRKPVKNPYLGYKFNPVAKDFPEPFDIYEQTLRYPTSFEKDAKSDVKRMKESLASIQDSVTSDTYRLFSIRNWDEFSNGSKSSGATANSLENIHGRMHNWIGGFGTPGSAPGHMSYIAVSAFDPIFWLHHCQVDRIIALWSAIYPGVWVGDKNVKNALEPFWNSTTSYWSSADCYKPDELNYSYPDFHVQRTADGMISRGAAEVHVPVSTKDLAHSINRLYGAATAKPTYYCHKDVSELTPNFAEAESTSRGGKANDLVNYYNEWSARIRCDPFELGSSFAVYVFLGSVPSEPGSWYKDEAFVGVYDAFVNSEPESCTNCSSRAAANTAIEGFVHLNVGILKRSNQTSLEPEVVEPYLKENLRWAVIKADGTAAELKSLAVEVLMTPLSIPLGVYFPVASPSKHYHNITLGVPGGARSG